MFSHGEAISLVNLGDGAAIEKFDEELQRVWDNIVDPNTVPDAIREVTLTLKIKPDKDRNTGMMSLIAKSKLAPDQEFTTTCIIGRSNTKGFASELKQGNLFPKQTSDKVSEISDRKEGQNNDR